MDRYRLRDTLSNALEKSGIAAWTILLSSTSFIISYSCNQLASAGKASSEPILVWVQDVFQIIMNGAKNNMVKHFARDACQGYRSKVAWIFSATFFMNWNHVGNFPDFWKLANV